MDINLDDDLRQIRSRYKSEERPSLSQWLLIISVAVFMGNMASWGMQRAIDYVLLRLAVEEMEKQTAIQLQKSKARLAEQQKINAAKLEEQRKINAANAKQRQLENEKRQAGLRQAVETCNFWRDQVRKDNNAQSRRYRDEACEMVNKFR